MFVTYTSDGDVQRWEFDPRQIRASKAEAIEQHAGIPWDQWLAAVQTGSMRARRVLLWHMLSEQHPTLRFEDTPDFYAGDLLLEYSAAELTEMRARVDKANLPEQQRQAVLVALDQALADATSDGEKPVGKAR